MTFKTGLLTCALTIAFILLFSPRANTQGLVGAREDHTALNGTRLTYYQQPNFGQCQIDCANNAKCKGFTWIQAGTYNKGDAAMCYLMAEVTGRAPARGHFSEVKMAASGGGTWAGKWQAYNHGDVTLEQKGDRVTGRYGNSNGIQGPGSIEGIVRGKELHFAWRSDRGQEGQAIWYPTDRGYAGKVCNTGKGCTPDGHNGVDKVSN